MRQFVAFLVLLVFTLLALRLEYPGKLEGHLFPVIENVSVEVHRDFQTRRSLIFLDFVKIRECRYLTARFYLETPDGQIILMSNLQEEARIRRLGEHRAGPWIVNSLVEEGSLLIEISHFCHYLWPTITTIS